MGYWSCKFNMTHPLTTHLGTSYLNAASLADNSLKPHSLVLTAITFPVTSWSKDLFIK